MELTSINLMLYCTESHWSKCYKEWNMSEFSVQWNPYNEANVIEWAINEINVVWKWNPCSKWYEYNGTSVIYCSMEWNPTDVNVIMNSPIPLKRMPLNWASMNSRNQCSISWSSSEVNDMEWVISELHAILNRFPLK